MICDTIVVFDHTFQTVKVVSHAFLPSTAATEAEVAEAYAVAKEKVAKVVETLTNERPTPMPDQDPIPEPDDRKPAESNVGKKGYEDFVTRLKKNIVAGDIIQAVPSQRLRKETRLHPFNVYRFVAPRARSRIAIS